MVNLYQVIKISVRNYELFNSSDLQEWYASRIIELILASLEEFQERDSVISSHILNWLLT